MHITVVLHLEFKSRSMHDVQCRQRSYDGPIFRLRFKHFPRYFVLRHPQSVFFPQGERPSCTHKTLIWTLTTKCAAVQQTNGHGGANMRLRTAGTRIRLTDLLSEPFCGGAIRSWNENPCPVGTSRCRRGEV
jgi:hypothetical protein